MRNKINILLTTFILTIIVFVISVNVQKKLIDYEAKVSCLIVAQDIYENQKVSEEMFRVSEVPISLVTNVSIVTEFEDIKDLYANGILYKGQIALKKQFDTKENLSIFECEDGTEKISVKIENPENGLSYAIKKNTLINLYVTLKNNYANTFLNDNERLEIGDEYDGYTVIKLLNQTKVLGTFNIDGIEVDNAQDGIVDSVMIAVTPDVAKQINLVREIGSFNITGVTKIKPDIEETKENIGNGDEQL